VIYFIVGLGGVAGALLAMVKLKEALVPDPGQQVVKDIATIKADIQDIRARVGMLELDVAQDRPARRSPSASMPSRARSTSSTTSCSSA